MKIEDPDFIIEAYNTIKQIKRKPRFFYNGKSWLYPKTHPKTKEKNMNEKDIKKVTGEALNQVIDKQTKTTEPPTNASFICTHKNNCQKHRDICRDMFGVEEVGGWIS